jgi:Protein kinase domain/MgtE intracellular N domain
MMTSEPRVLAGRYRLLSQIGAGGMGSVWLAEDQLLERAVALKELVQHVGAADLGERRARAVREARAMARVKHPAIVRIHDVFFADSDPWIVMDYIRGRSLATIIRDHPLDERAIAGIGLPVLRGLGAAHSASVLHRDVKPANIVVADDGSIFLVDFGIAKIIGDMTITSQSTLLGTPEFLAPERISGRPVGSAADLWSLSVTFFCALEGYSPFLRRSERPAEATMMAILHEPLPRLATTGRLAGIMPRLLEKDLAKRAGAGELARVLQSILDESAMRAPRQHRPASRQAPPAPRPRRAVLAGRQLRDAREMVRSVGTDAGVAMLLDMPEEHAAQVLAGYPAPVAGGLIKAIGLARPQAAGSILQILLSNEAGHALRYLSSRAAASILAAMPVGEAVRILSRADVRTAGGVIMELPSEVSAQVVKAMQGKRAAQVLEYVNPVTVAALLTSSGELNGKLLGQLSPPFRAQVMRHLPRPGRTPPLRS